jgi:hypothetical protein
MTLAVQKSAMTRFLLGLLLAVSLPLHAAPTGLLNDTGQDTCYDGTNLVACTAANSGDGAANPRQDGRFGRDAKAAAGTLTKTGAGAKGFDYTKICFNGNAEGSGTCTGTLVANTTAVATGTPSTDWACTKDNRTNLIWSLETDSGDWTTYAQITLPAATNAANRCGYNTGWRLPTQRELLSIVHNGTFNPAIDSAYFPGTQTLRYWSANTYAPDPSKAWQVNFSYGDPQTWSKGYGHFRLVRSGQ